MSETPNTQATPGTPAELSTPAAVTLAEPGTLVEPVEAQAEELSAESLRIASQLAEGYRVSPLDMVPNPSPLLVESTEEVAVPTPHGLFGMRAWRFADGAEHLSARALDRDGNPVPYEGGGAPAVRIHSECATGDIFGSFRCDCGPQLENGLRIIGRTGGYLVYVRNHEGRGIGLVNKLRAYALQDAGLDTLDANLALGLDGDMRDYSQAALILQELGVHEMRLVTNNPAKQEALEGLGLRVTELIPDEIPARVENAHYLHTKRERMRHLLERA